MGYFSWKDCKTNKAVKIGDTAYILVPAEFTDVYGNTIKTDSYNGYGSFGLYDAYDLVALWNRGKVSEANLEPAPKIDEYSGLYEYQIEEMREAGKSEDEIKEANEATKKKYYDNAMGHRRYVVDRLNDFNAGKDEEYMIEKYGEDYLREIGIDIGCYDRQNAALPYPLKVTHDENAIYEDCKPSKGDPKQGCN